ncbi:MAG: type II secretion system F family protein [Microthrixaceae bacterium]
MPLYVYLAALAIVGSVLVLWWGFSGPTTSSEVRANLATRGASPVHDFRQVDLARSTWERLLQPLAAAFGRRARRLTTQGLGDHLGRQLHLAGLSDQWTIERLLAVKLGLLVVAGAAIALRFLTGDITRAAVAQAIILLVVAYLAPDAMLARKARARQERIERELPDVIDQITVSVEAGLGFDGALARAAHTGRGLFATELTRVLQDVQVGLPRDTAFDRLLERTDVADLRHFVLAIRQSDRYGLPIANTLSLQAAELRDKRRARAEERAMRIPVKIVFPLTLCILPALFVVVLGPAILQIYDNF